MSRVEKQVTINLSDLRALVDQLFRNEVRQRAHLMALREQENPDPSVAFLFAGMVEAQIPGSEKVVELRYRHLLEALATGNSVAESLTTFLYSGR